MRNLLVWIAVSLLWTSTLSGQEESRQTPEVIKIEQLENSRSNLEAYRAQRDYFLPIKLDRLPDKRQQQRLKEKGIELISYRRNLTYLAKVPKQLSKSELADLGVREVIVTSASTKVSKAIQERAVPDWAIPQEGWLEVVVGLSSSGKVNRVKSLLDKLGAQVLPSKIDNDQIQYARIPEGKIAELASSPLVTFIDIVQEPDQPLNHELRNIQRVNVLNGGYNGIPGLNGSGVAIGIGDGGQLGEHIDFDQRVINKANGTYTSFGSHGDHVAGIVGGGGHIDPRNRGVASEATIITQKTSLVTYYAEDYFRDYGMVLTNNSYGTSFNCATNGTYNYSSLTLDKQLRELPEILHVFAAGNSGANTCTGYPQGYHTTLRYYQAAKNVLTVGNVTKERQIRSNSSRGPVADGRIKPEIVAVGSNVVSTGRDYDYFSASGTSMASPAVTATLALLYERYRQLHNGENPKGELIKAIACNTAEDLGMSGPDYIYGYGLINGRRAVEVINNQQFQTGEINQGEQNIHTITIPSGVKRVKAMLYWHDKEAEAFAEKALINDLDMTMVDPSANPYLPWVLDHNPFLVAFPASRKRDTLNNIEQITLDDPTPGTYQLVIDGSEVPFGAQSYVVVYDFVEEELAITFPRGGETLTPGAKEYIQWDADITNYEEFTLEYSADGGQSWEILDDGIGDNARQFIWTVPNETTQSGLLRISKNDGSNSAHNQIAFNIMKAPTELEATPYCDGIIGLSWKGVDDNNATYEVNIFDGEQMATLVTVSDTTYLVQEELEIGKTYWFSVTAVISPDIKSERTVATFCVPDPDKLCPWANDPWLMQAHVIERGRFNTGNSLRDDEDVSVIIRNVGTNSLDSVLVSYQVNNQPIVSEWVKEKIESGDTLYYEFIQKADLSEVGVYKINTWVSLPGDANPNNDSLINKTIAIQLENDQVRLPFGDHFVDAEDKVYTKKTMGLEGARSLDFDLLGNGQLVVDQGAFFLMPSDQTDTSNIKNDLIVTLDMTDYSQRLKMMLMHFKYYSLETGVGPLGDVKREASTVWVRGSDADEWVFVMELDNVSNWTSKKNIRIKEALQNAGQEFSASTQIRFRHNDSFGLAISDLLVEEPRVLPAEWINLQAAVTDQQVTLTWTTLNKDNVAYFEIMAAYLEKGKEHSPIYQTIARINSKSASDQGSQKYTFTDMNLFSEKVYYKIRQIDIDQNTSESLVQYVQIDKSMQDELTIFPNPFDAHINITTSQEFGGVRQVRLLNAQGKTIHTQENTSIKTDIKLSLPEIPAGYYFVELHTEKGVIRRKVVKQ